jgi:hypothetical protein
MNYLCQIVFCLFISVCVITACSGTPDEELPEKVKKLDNVTIHERNFNLASSITLIDSVAFENSEEVSFGQLTDVDVDNSGTVYIVEGSSGNEGIYVFDSEGTYIDKIGESGRGPGEFQALFDIDIADDQIYTLMVPY